MDALTSSVNVVAQKPRKRSHNQKSIFKNTVDSSYKNNENNKNDYFVSLYLLADCVVLFDFE